MEKVRSVKMSIQQDKENNMNLWKFIEKILDFILCKLLRLKINKTQWEALMQFVKFGIVGLSNTVISYVIYVVTLILFQKNNLALKYFLSAIVSSNNMALFVYNLLSEKFKTCSSTVHQTTKRIIHICITFIKGFSRT